MQSRLDALISRVILVNDLGEFRVDQKRPGELYATDPAAYDVVCGPRVIRLLTQLA